MNTVSELCSDSRKMKKEILKGTTDNTHRYDLLLLLLVIFSSAFPHSLKACSWGTGESTSALTLDVQVRNSGG